MNGWVLVVTGVFVAAMDAVIGLWFMRRPAGPQQAQQQTLGRIIMVAGLLPFFVLLSLGFGLFGPIDGIDAINLHQG